MTTGFSEELLDLAIYGVPLLLLVFWLTHVARRKLHLRGPDVDLVSIAIGLVVVGLARFVPPPYATVLFVGLGMAAAANLTATFIAHPEASRGDDDPPTPPPPPPEDPAQHGD